MPKGKVVFPSVRPYEKTHQVIKSVHDAPYLDEVVDDLVERQRKQTEEEYNALAAKAAEEKARAEKEALEQEKKIRAAERLAARRQARKEAAEAKKAAAKETVAEKK